MKIEYREKELRKLIDGNKLEIEKLLDIGGGKYSLFCGKGFATVTMDIVEGDIIQDLNKDQKLRFKDNSFTIVVLPQILEHLTNVEEIIEESKRVSSKYILIGLPNELKLDNRIRFLFGVPSKCPYPNELDDGYFPFGHKHFFTIKRVELFIKRFFGNYEKKYYIYGVSGGRFLPVFIRRFLANNLSSFFAGEVYYLVRNKQLNKTQEQNRE